MQTLPELQNSLIQDKLLKIFGDQKNIQKCIELIMSDRVFYNNQETHHFVKKLVADYENSYKQKIDLSKATPEELERFAKTDPVAFLILTIVNENDKNDVDTTALRDIAFESFQAVFKDQHFGRHFFYSRSLLPVLAYLFIKSGFWKPAGNDTVEETIGEQLMGIYKGTVSFSKGQVIPENIRAAILSKGEKPVDENGVTTKWFATDPLDDGIENRLDRFYLPSRRKIQKEIVKQYEAALTSTSEALAPIFSNKDRNVLMVIGPYGCGKSTYLKTKYNLEEKKSNLVSLSVDTLKGFFASALSAKSTFQDYHFECAILKDTVNTENVVYLFATGAYIDEYRFNSNTRAYSGKKVELIEIAPRSVQDAVVQYCLREHTDNYQFALPGANTAQQFRAKRIEALQTKPFMKNINYKLVCNIPEQGFVDVLEITTKDDGQRVTTIYNEKLHADLIKDYSVKGEEIERLLEEKKSSMSMKV